MSTGQPAVNLKARRVSASLTPERLAQLSGVSLRAVLQAEAAAALGKVANIHVNELQRIAAVLGTTIADLRGF